MLVGTYKHAVDNKNRMFIPVRFRPDLGLKCVLSRDIMYDCLNVYSVESWEAFTEKIEALPTIKMRAVRQLIYPNSDEVEPDSQGRIILNQRLCADVGLANAKEVMIIGANTHAQIWNVEQWEQFNEKLSQEQQKEAILADLSELGF